MPDATAINIDTQEDEQIQDEKPKKENIKNGQNSSANCECAAQCNCGCAISLGVAKLINYRNNLRELRELARKRREQEFRDREKSFAH